MALAQLPRPGCRLPRVLLVPPSRQEPGQPGLRHGGVGGLPELVGQAGRLEVAGFGVGPAVGGRVVAGDGADQQGEVRRRRPHPQPSHHRTELLACGALAQEHRSEHRPVHAQRVLGTVADRHREAGPHELGPPVAVPRQDVGHARSGEADPADRVGGRGTHEVDHASCHRERGRGVAEVEAGVHRVGEEEHRTVGVGPGCLGRTGEEGVAGSRQRAAARLHRTAQLADPHRLLRGEAVRQPVQQRRRPGRLAREPGLPGSRQSAGRAVTRLRGERRCPLQHRRRHRVGAAVLRVGRGAHEHHRDRLVRARGRLGQVPGAAVPHGRGRRDPLHLAERVGQRAVGPAPTCRVGCPVDGCAHERVPERDDAGADPHQPGTLGVHEVADVETVRPAGPVQQGEVPGARGREQQHLLRAVRQPGRPRREGVLQTLRERHRDAGLQAAQVVGALGELEQRERVAGGGAVQHGHPVATDGGADQRRRRADGQAGQRQRSEPRVGQRGRLAGPQRHQHGHPVVDQPPQRERDRLGGRPVEQVGVVDQDQQGLVVGRPAEQAEGGHPDPEPVRARARPGAQRDTEGLLLRGREPGQEVGEGSAELVQPGERHLLLRG